MLLKEFTGGYHKDENLKPYLWANDDKAQAHYLESYLHEKYPKMVDKFPKIKVPAGKVGGIPHRYYKIFTRDGTPAKGRNMPMDENLEMFANNSITSDVFQKPGGVL